MLHSSGTCFDKSSDQESLKNVLGGNMVNMDKSPKQLCKYDKKWKRELESLKN